MKTTATFIQVTKVAIFPFLDVSVNYINSRKKRFYRCQKLIPIKYIDFMIFISLHFLNL